MFRIPVKIPALERRRKSVGLLHVVAGFFLFANIGSAYKVVAPETLRYFVPFYVAAFAFVAYGFFRKKLDAAYAYNKVLRLLQAAAFLIIGILLVQAGAAAKSIGPFIWAVLALLLAATESAALSPPVLLIDEKGVSLPGGVAQQRLLWHEITGITLRPDFITIHRSGNKLLQLERTADPQDFSDADFELFLQQKTAVAKPQKS